MKVILTVPVRVTCELTELGENREVTRKEYQFAPETYHSNAIPNLIVPFIVNGNHIHPELMTIDPSKRYQLQLVEV